MKRLRRHKTVLLVLGIYWPLIFWLTHIPVPQVARKSGMSDKTMHVLAYFVLTFLVWFAVSPYHKVRWKSLKPWIVLAAVAVYGMLDEFLQSLVGGRSADVIDFAADLLGIVICLGLLSVFGFWMGSLIAAAAFIFILSNASELLTLYPQYHLSVLFHGTAYAAFSTIWVRQIVHRIRLGRTTLSCWMRLLIVPLALLIAVKLTAPVFGRPVHWADIAAALFGIAVSIPLAGRFFVPAAKK